MDADARGSAELVARALTESAEAAVVISSSAGIEYTNDAFCRLTGFSPGALTGTALQALVLPDLRSSTAGQLGDLLRGTHQSHSHHVVLTREDGTALSAEHTARALDADGRRVAVSTFVPIRNDPRMAGALSASEARYGELFDEDVCGRFEATPGWEITRCNNALAQMLGYAASTDIRGRCVLDFAVDELVLHKLVAIARANGRAGPAELQFQNTNGELVDASCSLVTVADPSGELTSMRGIVDDVTGTRRVQGRLLGAERMELLARLAGGLAHDFNNLLTIIKGHSDRLSEALPAGGPLRESAVAIDQASAAAASLTRQLLAFGRRQVFELRPLSLAHLLADAEPMLRHILGDRVRLRVSAAAGLPEIRADARQIEDVVVNLATNARDAMPSEGMLTIRLDTMDVGGPTPRDRQWLRSGRYVRLLVSDTGTGMDPVARAHAFQPFFTTKQMGGGRGLGLATVYGIVKQSNGFVWVESAAGKGATFTLLFPAIESARPESSSSETTATEAILVVEEDERFRAFIGDALRRRGYTALLAASASDAVALVAAHPSRIHLLVADGGIQNEGLPLAARLTAIDPMLQSLVVLEEGATNSGRRGVLPTTPTIEKPFTLQALADKVRSVLDSGEGRSKG